MTGRFLLLAAVLATSGVFAEPDERQLRQWLDEHMAAALTDYELPGAVVVIVGGGLDEPLLGGYGLADVDQGLPMDPVTTVVRVGSVSKAVTATLALIAEAGGELPLDEDLRAELADLPIDWYPGETLTPHHLLTFTGGFDEQLFGQHFAAPTEMPELAAFLRSRPLHRFIPAGRISAYTDPNTMVLGLVLERRAGLSFDELARARLFEPLAMDSSTFDQRADFAGRLARAYERRDGRWDAYPRDYIASTPAAGLYTTAADMGRYLSALLRRTPDRLAILGDDRWARHMQRQFAHHPELFAWGYGLAEDRREGFPVWFKDGQASGFHARILVVPELELALFSAHNRNIIGPGGHFHRAARFNRDLGDALLQAFYAERSVPHGLSAPDAAAVDPTPYLGRYRNAVQSRHSFERIITLMDEIVVEPGETGLMIHGVEWLQTRPGVVQYIEGGQNFRGFGTLRDGRYRHLFAGRGAYERVPWVVSAAGAPFVLGALGLLALTGLMLGGLRLKRGDRPGVGWLLICHGLLMAIFPLGLAAFFMTVDIQRLFLGAPLALNLLLTLPLAACALQALLALRALQIRAWGLLAYALAWIGPMAWLSYWGLIGPELG